jgi:PKD repeat protein
MVVDFIASPIPAYVNMPVQFVDQSTGDPDTWDWDFGDGSTHSSLQNPYHSYTRQGLYTISLIITKGVLQSQIYKKHYIEILLEDVAIGFVRSQGPTLIFD